MPEAATGNSLGTLVAYLQLDATQYSTVLNTINKSTATSFDTLTAEVKQASDSVTKSLNDIGKGSSGGDNIIKMTTSINDKSKEMAASAKIVYGGVAAGQERVNEVVTKGTGAYNGLASEYFKANEAAKQSIPPILASAKALDTTGTVATGLKGKFTSFFSSTIQGFSQLATKAKVATYPIQSDWTAMVDKMKTSSNGLLSSQRIFQGILQGIGIGSALQIIPKIFGDIADAINAPTERLKQLKQESIEVGNSFAALHDKMVAASVTKFGPEEGARLLNLELEKTKGLLSQQQTELDKIQKSMLDAAQGQSKVSDLLKNDVVGAGKYSAAVVLATMAFGTQGRKAVDYYFQRTKSTEAYSVLQTAEGKKLEEINDLRAKALEQTKGITEQYKETVELAVHLAEAQDKFEMSYSTFKKNDYEGVDAGQAAGAEALKQFNAELLQQKERLMAIQNPSEVFRKDLEQLNYLQKLGTVNAKEYANAYQNISDKFADSAIRLASADIEAANQRAMNQHQLMHDAISDLQYPKQQNKTGDQNQDAFIDIANQQSILAQQYKEESKMMKEKQDEQLGAFKVGSDAYTSIQAAQYQKRKELLEKYNAETGVLERQQASLILTTQSQIFSDLSDIAKASAGEQSGIYKAMFAVSKSFAIADALIKIQQGIANAFSMPWPTNLAAAASVISATAGIISNIQSVALSFEGGGSTGIGARTGGMDGRGGFMAMLHPQERVIDDYQSARSGSGANQTHVTVNQNFAPGVSPQEMIAQTQKMKQETIALIPKLVAQGGAYRRAIQQ